MRVFMFPGQGSQFPGMGKDLFGQSRMYGPLESRIDRIAGFSIRQMCLDGDEATLSRTDVTQPCLYIVNALYHEYQAANGKAPDWLAGHSLGEYNALQAAGAFDLLDGLRMVVRRGQIMAALSHGAMAAIIGMAPHAIAGALAGAGLDDLDIANLNTPDQTVISGPAGSIEKAEMPLVAAGALAFVKLPVGAAFHSRAMEPAAASFDASLETIVFHPLRKTVISNVTARPYPNDGDPGTIIRSLLVRQLKSMVLWAPTIGYLKAAGANEFIEVGPGSVLARMVAKIPALDDNGIAA
ncbi:MULTISPECIES: ACP S-malonyltransferase [unclassified Mesorhizobium]|uniref:ACP S-malonyltransferase n=1 Tax=unclassified Mesorhizobium TaxID=325217 RepID=UPI000AC2CB17|nr:MULTISPECIES: ACP S-malonyltransferase [unclassified Mesorhizobium]MDR7033688.1 malonyl CoA-acyl carrier protein transacylase [Mesorhizobium sp. BE184]